MSTSVARLVARRAGDTTRISRAFAQAPQRWTYGQPAADGWSEVSHQVLGDGAFGGDRSRAAIRVHPGASLVVRGVAATPLRGDGESAAVVRIRAEAGGAVIYAPGAIVPHAGSSHTSSLRVSADVGARVFAATTLVPGRSAMGETGAFVRLRMKSRVELAGELALSEDTEVVADDLARMGSLGNSGAFVSAICLGEWTPGDNSWWAAAAGDRGLVACSPLRTAGVSVRGLFRTLGDAHEFLAAVESRLRLSHASCIRAASNGSGQVLVY